MNNYFESIVFDLLNHYPAILAGAGDSLELIDPKFSLPRVFIVVALPRHHFLEFMTICTIRKVFNVYPPSFNQLQFNIRSQNNVFNVWKSYRKMHFIEACYGGIDRLIFQ